MNTYNTPESIIIISITDCEKGSWFWFLNANRFKIEEKTRWATKKYIACYKNYFEHLKWRTIKIMCLCMCFCIQQFIILHVLRCIFSHFCEQRENGSECYS